MNTLSFNIYIREETEKQIRAKIKIKLKQMMKEARRLRVLISILTSYAIFTLPNTITMSCWLFGAILDLWQQDGITFRILTGTSTLLLSFKYSLNFYLYSIANSYIFEQSVKGRLQKIKIKSNWNFPIGVSTHPPTPNWKKKSWSKNTLNHIERVLNQTHFLMLLAPLCLF